ncbi:MAG: peptidoglycan DD-metalloendopeptidase family protein [Coriobacteriaceae bacterium]|jgi:murein DD-endopeptidase MepM/ murein hydrolase activator NlpD|nr:peptidoglycan DD-metalloendopeptidase family protein [Coriobacteriaceae bacterium]
MLNLNKERTLYFSYAIGLCILAIIVAFSALPRQMAYAVTSDELFAEADRIFERIDVLQTDINNAQADYDQALEEHKAAIVAMRNAEARIRAAEARIAELQAHLADRAHSMYKNGPAVFFDVLLGATSFESFLNSWDMIEKISAQDAEFVQETKEMRAEQEAAREEYSFQAEIASDKMTVAANLKAQIEETQEALRKEAASITAEAMELKVQEELEAERARQAAAAAEAMRKQLERNAASASPGLSVVSGSGILSHPCPNSSISSTFGWRSFDNAFHQGTDFAAPQGTPIYAADGGTVIYATYNGAYNGGAGNWVVIAHGGGMVTKYMHASAVFVSTGDQVARGDNIAAVGNTGNSFGAHLHFQVEVNGVAVDPLLFL